MYFPGVRGQLEVNRSNQGWRSYVAVLNFLRNQPSRFRHYDDA